MSRNEASIEICDDRIIHQGQVAKAAQAMLTERILDDLADIFKILSHQTRLKILHALSSHELCVCDLAALLSMSESAVSHQLRPLRTMRLVRSRREGKLVYYALDDDHVQQLFAAALDHIQE
jgi:ArsR family transcriptional regulator, lead/cadmium/zinc/bismuth-responsive transcriptional repressor